VKQRDRALVEWVANASAGDRVPEPWRWAPRPTHSVILTLIDVGVIVNPPPGSDQAAVVREASAAARTWLDEHA